MRFAALRNQLLRYGGWTLLSAAMSLGLPVLLHELMGVEERVAVAIALAAAFAMNFFGIRGWVFGKSGGVRGDLARFAAVSLGFRLLEYAGFLLLFSVAGFDYMPALLIPLLVSFCLKFVTYKLIVFAPR